MDHFNYFGDCLKELLADSGMSIKELSERLCHNKWLIFDEK